MNQYTLNTLADVYKLPADRRAACMAEILDAMEMADRLSAKMKARSISGVLEFREMQWGDGFVWIDDGLTNQDIKMRVEIVPMDQPREDGETREG